MTSWPCSRSVKAAEQPARMPLVRSTDLSRSCGNKLRPRTIIMSCPRVNSPARAPRTDLDPAAHKQLPAVQKPHVARPQELQPRLVPGAAAAGPLAGNGQPGVEVRLGLLRQTEVRLGLALRREPDLPHATRGQCRARRGLHDAQRHRRRRKAAGGEVGGTARMHAPAPDEDARVGGLRVLEHDLVLRLEREPVQRQPLSPSVAHISAARRWAASS
jgi:hypothetical protein